MNIVLFGAPGAGKGTQSAMLVKDLGMTQVSTGDLFRAAIKEKTNLGLEAQSFMDRGALVPDTIVIGMVEEVLKANRGREFILDGFPRTVVQAEALERVLEKLDIHIDRAVFLEVPFTVLLGRLSGRRVCKKCGSVYHLLSAPTRVEGICDKCGETTEQRADDNESVIGTRLRAYSEFTAPLKDYYQVAGKLIEIDGNQSVNAIFGSIKKLLDKAI